MVSTYLVSRCVSGYKHISKLVCRCCTATCLLSSGGVSLSYRFYKICITIIGNKWCINGISTGSGKSAVISMLAHKLADQGDDVWVVTTNELLKVQLIHGYFSTAKTTKGKITMFSAQEPQFMRTLKDGIYDPSKIFLVIDEFDRFSNADRMLLFHGVPHDQVGVKPAKTFLIESLQLCARFKMVFGFCPEVGQEMSERVNTINKALIF